MRPLGNRTLIAALSLMRLTVSEVHLESGDSESGMKRLGEAREGWAAIKYENGVQWVDELLAEDEEVKDAE